MILYLFFTFLTLIDIIYYVKKYLLSTVILILILLTASCVLFACTPQDNTIVVTDFELLSSPTRTYMLVGEELDLSGAQVKITYESGLTETKSLLDIFDRITIDGYDSSSKKFGESVVITYQDKSISFVIDVVEPEDVLTLSFVTSSGIVQHSVIAGKTVADYIDESTLIPTIDGYYFGGWYSSPDDGRTLVDYLDFSGSVYESATYYPRWQVVLTYVETTYDSNTDTYKEKSADYKSYVDVGGEVTESEYNEILKAIGFIDKQGFKRAVKDSMDGVDGLDHTEVYALTDIEYGDFFKNLTENKTIYLVYLPDLVKVYFDLNGATAIRKPHDATGTVDFLTETKGDHIGWSYLEYPYGKELDLAEVVDLGKSIDEGDLDDLGTAYTYSYTFTFSGWYTDETYTDTCEYKGEPLSEDIELHARWMWFLSFYTADEGSINHTICDSVYFDEGESFSYIDLPAVPETFTDSKNATVTRPSTAYSSWWSFKKELTGATTEYNNILLLDTEYNLGDCIESLTDKAVIYACFNRIPYHITFDALSASAQQPTDIADGIDTFYGEYLQNYQNSVGEGDFESWYTDKQLQNKVAVGKTTVQGDLSGFYGYHIENGQGVVILDGDTYYIADGNAYLENPRFVETPTAVGTYSQNILTLGTVTIDLTSLTTKTTQGDMTLYAGYTITASFVVNVMGKSESSTTDPVKKEYIRDGEYVADISEVVPALPTFEGMDAFWLQGSTDGTPSSTALINFETDGTLPDFTKITENNLTFVAYPVLKRYDIKFILNAQKDTDFATVYALNQEYLDTEGSQTVEYGKYASFYEENKIIREGDSEKGLVEWKIDGYYTDSLFTTEFSFSTAIDRAYTLYAKWTRVGTVGIVYDDNNIVRGFDQSKYTAYYGTDNSADLKILVIPEENDGTPVITIGNSAFEGKTTITDIYVGKTVKTINEKAFNGCTSLSNLHDFYEFVYLSSNVFGNTLWLENATATAKKTDGKVIFNGNQLYKYVGTSKTLEIGKDDGINVIGYSALEGNTTLKEITVAGEVRAVRPYAFSYISTLEKIDFSGKSLMMQDGIGVTAFTNLPNLQSINLDGTNYRSIDGVLYRMDGSYPVQIIAYPANSTSEILVLPDTLTYIGEYVFQNATHLQAVVFSSTTAPTLQTDSVFDGITSLKYLLIGTDSTYQGDDLGHRWKTIISKTSYQDKIKYGKTTVEYISNHVEMTGTPQKTSYIYGAKLTSFVPTNKTATFVGWYLDEDLTVKWNNDLTSWQQGIDILDATLYTDKTLTESLTLYAKWIGTISTGEENLGDISLVLGKTLTDDQITLKIGDTYYYGTVSLDGTVTFENLSMTANLDRVQKTLTLTDGATSTIYSFDYPEKGDAIIYLSSDDQKTPLGFINLQSWFSNKISTEEYTTVGYTTDWQYEDGTVMSLDAPLPKGGKVSIVQKVSTYTVNLKYYDYIDGKYVDFTTITVNHGDAIGNIATPTHRDIDGVVLTFGGWYQDQATAVSRFLTTDAVTKDLTLYARWTTRLTTKYMFDGLDGEITEGQVQTTLYNAKLGKNLSAANKKGYSYTWYIYKDGAYSLFDLDTVITTELTLYAVYTRLTYTVDFVSSYSTPPASQTVAYGDHVEYPQFDSVYGDYAFAGWYVDEAFTTPYLFSDAVTSNLTLYASFAVNSKLVLTYTPDGTAYGVTGSNARDEVIYIPTTAYKRANVYSIYKTDTDGVLTDILAESRFEDGNNSLTITDDLGIGAFSGGSVKYYVNGETVYKERTFTTTIGSVSYRDVTDGRIATVTINYPVSSTETQTFTYYYYTDSAHASYEAVEIEGSTVTTILASAFEGNDKIKHLIISQYISEIKDTAFDNMTALEKITVLPDGNAYYYVSSFDASGNPVYTKLLNCNGYFASIDGVLYSIGSGKIAYNDGKKVSLEKIVKFPQNINIEDYTLELSNFTVKGTEPIFNQTGISIGRSAFEGVKYLKNLKIKATTRSAIGENAFKNHNSDLRIFVPSKQDYIDGGGYWSNYQDIIYPSIVTVSYINPFDGSTLYSSVTKDVFDTADEIICTEIFTNLGMRYTFGGWSTTKTADALYDFTLPLTEDLTLYARFILDSSKGLEYTKVTLDGEAVYQVSIGTCTAKDIVIANFYMDLPVRVIGSGAFLSTKIESIYIPSTITTIKDSAFTDISTLKTITVSEDSTRFTVKDGVLYTIDYEELILYPAKSTSTEYEIIDGVKIVRRSAFYANGSLTRVVVPATVTEIGYSAFGNSSIERIVFLGTTPPTLTADAFYGAPEKLLLLVPGIEGAETYIERYKEAWTGIIPKNRIDNIFASTVYLYLMQEETENQFVVYQVLSTEYGTTIGATTDSPLRNSYVFIGWYDTEYIDGNLFSFENDILYKDTYLYARWTPSTPDGLIYTLDGDVLKVSVSDSETVKNLTKIVIDSQRTIGATTYPVRIIDNNAFEGLTNLKEIVIPSTVRTIGNYAFKNCSSLETISLPMATLSAIGDGAFEGCHALKTISIPSTIITISQDMFKNCINLTTVVFWGAPTTIGDSAFEGCISLRNIDLSNRLTTIGNSAFKNCQSLTSITIPATITLIGESAFEGCRAMTKATIEDGANLRYKYKDTDGTIQERDGLGASAFKDCVKLTTFTIPTGLTAIPTRAFYNCMSLTDIVIPKDITRIGASSFEKCVTLKSLTFEDGIALKEIWSQAFAYCTALTEVNLPFTYDDTTSIGTRVFLDDINLQKVSITCTDSSGEHVLITSATQDEDMFLMGCDNAYIYVPTDLIAEYRATYSVYSTRLKPLTSKITYMIAKGKPYRNSLGYTFDNPTDSLILDDNVLSAPPLTYATAYSYGWDYSAYTFGGWGYYEDNSSILSLYDFSQGVVGEEGLTLYAIWIKQGTSGLSYVMSYDGTIQVSQGSIGSVEHLVIANYYLYNGKYLPVTRISGELIKGTQVKSVYIPETITFIQDNAFVGCDTLESFEVSPQNTSFQVGNGIENYALYTIDYKKIISFPSVTKEGSGYEFKLDGSVTTITQYTFESAQDIASFIIVNVSATPSFAVENGVLYNASKTTLVCYPALRQYTTYTLPSTVSTIYSSALNLSESSILSQILVEVGNTSYESIDGILYKKTGEKKELVRYPSRKDGDADGKYYIDTTVVSKISDYAFRYATLRGVIIDSTTTIPIGKGVFDDTDLYILVQGDLVNTVKVASGYTDYPDKILAMSSTLTFDAQNGDKLTTLDIDTLSAFPTYQGRDPVLPYSTHGNWYYIENGKKVEIDSTSTQYVYHDTTLYLDWQTTSTTEGLTFVLNETGDGYEVSRGTAVGETIIVPTYYNGLPVVAIATEGFKFAPTSTEPTPTLNTLVLPSTLVKIGLNGLLGETHLTNLVMLSTTAVEIVTDGIDPLEVIDDYRRAVADADWQQGEDGTIQTLTPMYFYVREDCVTEYKKGWPSLTIRNIEAYVNFVDVDGQKTFEPYKFTVIDGVSPDVTKIDLGISDEFTVTYYKDQALTEEYTPETLTRGLDNIKITVYIKINTI